MSIGLLGLETAVKRKPGRPKTETPTAPARLRSDIVRKARWIAMAKGVTIWELLSDMLEPMVNREYDKVEKPKG